MPKNPPSSHQLKFSFSGICLKVRASLVALLVKNLPAIRGTWVQFLGWEDRLEKEMTTHSSILAWRIPWTEEPGGLQPMSKVRHEWDCAYMRVRAHTHTHTCLKVTIYACSKTQNVHIRKDASNGLIYQITEEWSKSCKEKCSVTEYRDEWKQMDENPTYWPGMW